ncbi:non-hydrolyzing UDP-N-acetylglucosamine 2-epimerase [Kitasatospora azatica]|uniref:non-hydrolyzing UDP-N-acetylglucosamine 2-epimerase n=1 Tax=Kitasatospora azatica TaxID=58347 RepID=UPI0009FF694C|nr:UDP-N-acetylglucosamine 2-epimerase (non-hydrolyzing) [Kitasatospora azatica]
MLIQPTGQTLGEIPLMLSQTDRPIALVIGTRPELIKLAGVARLLGDNALLVDTGQHYDESLSADLFHSQSLPEPQAYLEGVHGQCRGAQIGTAISALTAVFTTTQPAAVIVQGHTNSTSAGAQAAQYCDIPIIHVEAGLRSHDRTVLEEHNRRVVGVLADVHCAATQQNAANLIAENTDPARISVTGNTIVEATLAALPGLSDCQGMLARHGLTQDQYVLTTIHRPENTDDPERLETILRELASLPLPVVFPTHPRTEGLIQTYGLAKLAQSLYRCPLMGHPEFLGLARNARLLISDSGGMQEECTVIKRPLVVVRNRTDRPEAITAGFATLVPERKQISQAALRILDDADLPARLAATRSPYGDGRASWRIGLLAMALQRGVAAADAAAAVHQTPMSTDTGQELAMNELRLVR